MPPAGLWFYWEVITTVIYGLEDMCVQMFGFNTVQAIKVRDNKSN